MHLLAEQAWQKYIGLTLIDKNSLENSETPIHIKLQALNFCFFFSFNTNHSKWKISLWKQARLTRQMVSLDKIHRQTAEWQFLVKRAFLSVFRKGILFWFSIYPIIISVRNNKFNWVEISTIFRFDQHTSIFSAFKFIYLWNVVETIA